MSENNIFDNQDERAENIIESAENLGIDRKNVEMLSKPRRVVVAKKNCKKCFGTGFLRLFPPGEKIFIPLRCKCLRVKELD